MLCRDIFHCLPSQLRQEKALDILAALTVLKAEAKVNEAKRSGNQPADV